MATKDLKKEPVVAAEAVTEKVEVVEVVEVKKEAPKKVKKELDRNLIVECRNANNGPLTYVSKRTQSEYNWANLGDVEFIELQELLIMKSSQPRFINEPWIVIDDEDVIEYLGLKQVYDRIIPIDSIEQFFYKSPEEIKEILAKAPKGTKELVIDKARQMVANDTLYDVRIIRTLDEALNIELMMIQN